MDPHIKNIVFDFGGVLIDWNPRYLYRSYFRTEEEMEYFFAHICTNEWNARQDAGRPFAEGVALLQARHPEYAEAIAIYHTRWNEMVVGAIQENVDWLRELKSQGYHIYGLTNWSAETLPGVMAKYDFFKLMDGIVVSGEEHLLKPDIRIYQTLLDRYHLRAGECLFIDDSPANIEGAKKAGLATWHIPTSTVSP
ncbi:MAG: HAD family phosphatase [Bacteroidales bacterium]|nr:HAD family phosphatase [Bacteroidales bacterium]